MKKTIEQAIADSKPARVMDYFSQGFNIVFQKPIHFLGFMIIFLGLGLGVNEIPGGGIIQNLLIAPLLFMGLFVFTDRINYQEPVDFGNFFLPFRQKVFPLLGANLLRYLILLPFLMIIGYGYMDILGEENIDAILQQRPEDLNRDLFNFTASNLLWVICGAILTLLVAILYLFTSLMIWFKGLGVLQALAASRKLAAKHFLSLVGFMLLAIVINLAGAMLFGIGMLVTIPATYCAIYIAFDDLVEAREVEEEDEIMNHFIA